MLTPVSEVDYLDEDAPIRGQSYCCVSFISPEEVIKSKEAFMLSKFTKGFSKVMTNLFNELEKKYPDQQDGLRIIKENYAFVFDEEAMNSDFRKFMVSNPNLEREFDKENSFRTSVRGIKVRGSYDSLEEAQARAEVLKRKDNGKHNILIGQVGCWMPISMNIDDIEKQEYAVDELNTMMKEYNLNVQRTEEQYNLRKKKLKENVIEHGKILNNAEASTSKDATATATATASEVMESISV
jgi:hypothetical protein